MRAWRSILVVTGVALLGSCSQPNAGTSSMAPNAPEARRYALQFVPACFCYAATGSGTLSYDLGGGATATIIISFDVIDKGATGDLGTVSTGTGPTTSNVDPNSVVISGSSVTFTYTRSAVQYTVSGDTTTGLFSHGPTPVVYSGTLTTTRTERCELLDVARM